MKVKSKDRISLPNGSIMTLGEALDGGLLELVESTYYDPPRYFARFYTGADAVSWEVAKPLYLQHRNNLP